MFLINYIKNNGEIDILININTFLNYYINSFEFRVKWFFIVIFIIINLDFINFILKLIIIRGFFWITLREPFELTYL